MAGNVIRPTDDEARALARSLLNSARYAALGVLLPDGNPLVTRIAFGLCLDARPLTLVSDLSEHTKALRRSSVCSVMIGEPGDKGDPLTHPRLTLQACATFVEHDDPTYAEMAAHYLRSHPKSKLYIGFGDFCFVRFVPERAFLNGGFGKAFQLTPKDLV